MAGNPSEEDGTRPRGPAVDAQAPAAGDGGNQYSTTTLPLGLLQQERM